jgi:hypothetical protein
MADSSSKDTDELSGTEQPFVHHLKELRDRLVKATIAVALVCVVLSLYPGPALLYDFFGRPAGGPVARGHPIDCHFGHLAVFGAIENHADDGVFDRLAGGALPRLGIYSAWFVHA